MKLELTIALVCLTAMARSDAAAEDRAYRYELDMSQDERVCGHMLEVYNRFFRELWKAKDWRKKFVGTPDNPKWEINEDFGAAGMYAFPKTPGTEHSPEFAYNMRS